MLWKWVPGTQLTWPWPAQQRHVTARCWCIDFMRGKLQYIPRNMHTVFALLCFVVVIYWLIFPYPSGLLHWHCGNLTIAPVTAKQPWWIWINTSCEFIMNDCITTTKQSTTKPCAYFLGYTVIWWWVNGGFSGGELYTKRRPGVYLQYSHNINLIIIMASSYGNLFRITGRF